MTEKKSEEATEDTAPVARIVSDKVRFKSVPLEWPVEFDGKTIKEVTVRRVSAKEVADYLDLIRQPGADAMPPNLDIPRAVYDALDDDDLFEIEKVSRDFFPRRLLALMEPSPDAHEK